MWKHVEKIVRSKAIYVQTGGNVMQHVIAGGSPMPLLHVFLKRLFIDLAKPRTSYPAPKSLKSCLIQRIGLNWITSFTVI